MQNTKTQQIPKSQPNQQANNNKQTKVNGVTNIKTNH